jgi:hypothetical protein
VKAQRGDDGDNRSKSERILNAFFASSGFLFFAPLRETASLPFVQVGPAQKIHRMSPDNHFSMHPILTASLFMAFAFALTGCAKPLAVAFDQVCTTENNEKYISVEGYLKTGVTVLCSSHGGTRTCGLELFDKPDGQSKISVDIQEGTGKSQMEALPKNYSSDDLKIRAQDGSAITARDRVRIIGTAATDTGAGSSSLNVCYINVAKVEKL